MENDLLQKDFSEEEIREAIFGCYANGAPRPDGLSFLFYQTFWDLIKNDFMDLVRDFEKGELDLYRLNFALVVLIRKEPDAKDMKKFRPISLSNCAIRIFTKAMTNRFSPISNRLISHNQTASIKGRFILESVVMAHEVIHVVKKSGAEGLVLKLDYEKAYNRVSWDFLFEMLSSRGFGTKWINWIKSNIMQSSFSVRINDTNGPYFVGWESLKQGDPLSPLLFNLVADVFSKMLFKAARHGIISGLLPHIIPGGVVSLQYVDDTLLFLENPVEKARNFK